MPITICSESSIIIWFGFINVLCVFVLFSNSCILSHSCYIAMASAIIVHKCAPYYKTTPVTLTHISFTFCHDFPRVPRLGWLLSLVNENGKFFFFNLLSVSCSVTKDNIQIMLASAPFGQVRFPIVLLQVILPHKVLTMESLVKIQLYPHDD